MTEECGYWQGPVFSQGKCGKKYNLIQNLQYVWVKFSSTTAKKLMIYSSVHVKFYFVTECWFVLTTWQRREDSQLMGRFIILFFLILYCITNGQFFQIKENAILFQCNPSFLWQILKWLYRVGSDIQFAFNIGSDRCTMPTLWANIFDIIFTKIYVAFHISIFWLKFIT